MNSNTKTSFSLNKKNKKISSSQKSLKNIPIKRNNHSRLSHHFKQNIDLNDFAIKQNSTVYQQYYPSANHYQNRHNIQQPQKLNGNQNLNNQKLKNLNKIAQQVQQKIKRALQNPFNNQPNNQDINIVFEQSDVDEDFLEKIILNKQLIKKQRQFKNTKLNLISQRTLKNNDFQQIKKISQINPVNIIENTNKIEKDKDKTFKKGKSKSLFPPIKNLSLKAITIGQAKDKIKLNYPQTKQSKNIIIQTNQFKNQSRSIKQFKQYSNQTNKQQIQNQNKNKKNKNIINMKRKFILHSLSQVKLKQINKKQGQLKLDNRFIDLKNRIGQRKSGKNLKNRLSIINQDDSKNNSSQFNPLRNSPRYSSNSLFDNIQQFLSNPHQNHSKSQMKYFKIYQKITQKSSKKNLIQQKTQLKQKIIEIQEKIKILDKNIQINLNQQINNQNIVHNHKQCNILKKQNESSIEQKQKNLQISPSLLDQQNSQQGVVQWMRLQKDKVTKSDFEKELKYVLSLQHKNQIILGNYIENKKLLQEINLLKNIKPDSIIQNNKKNH